MMLEMIACAGWTIVVVFAMVHCYNLLNMRRNKAERRRLAATLSDRGVRSSDHYSSDNRDIHDECLRRGYPLHEAAWIAARAQEAGGDPAAVQKAELDLIQERARNDRS